MSIHKVSSLPYNIAAHRCMIIHAALLPVKGRGAQNHLALVEHVDGSSTKTSGVACLLIKLEEVGHNVNVMSIALCVFQTRHAHSIQYLCAMVCVRERAFELRSGVT